LKVVNTVSPVKWPDLPSSQAVAKSRSVSLQEETTKGYDHDRCTWNSQHAKREVVKATPEALYRAFTDPAALAVWQAPGDMTGKVHSFDYRVGGGYQMSLYYPHPKRPPEARREKGKIDILCDLWN
jgi:hypothetical protein